MQLNRTIIISSEDNSIAKELFKNLVQEEDVILMVILGNDEKAKKAVKYADARARVEIQGFQRKVAWVLNKTFFKEELYPEVSLDKGESDFSIEKIDEIVAFSVSLSDTIKDVIKTNEKIDFSRIELAFLEAGIQKSLEPSK
jgi:hypothetical protein